VRGGQWHGGKGGTQTRDAGGEERKERGERGEGKERKRKERRGRTAATPALLLLRNMSPKASVAPGAVTSVFTRAPSWMREHLLLSKPCPHR
jgi:hypothetical protein